MENVILLVPEIEFYVIGGSVHKDLKRFSCGCVRFSGFLSISEIEHEYEVALCIVVRHLYGRAVCKVLYLPETQGIWIKLLIILLGS